MPAFPLQPSDLRATARLVVQATLGLTALVEQMHARVLTLPGREAPARTGGLTGGIYAAVRGITQGVGGGLELALRGLEPALRRLDPELASDEREALRAALNGVLGDHLAAQQNPLAVQMALRGSVAEGKGALLMLHGLCMNERQWRHEGRDLGETLAAHLGLSPIWLHYNTGLALAHNGALLAEKLEAFADVERLVLVGHSMGGLVARSALAQGRNWPARVSDLVCLGSPHGGAALERIGHGIDQLLAALPYAAPFTRLSRLRSAGILDLRKGSATRLPRGLRSHAIAARLPGAGRVLGDGLVTVASALGRSQGLAFDNTAVLDGLGYMALMHDPAVEAQLKRWLRPS